MAWHITDLKGFLGVVAESLESGWSIKNPNRLVSVIAWPVAALAKRSYPGLTRCRSGRKLRDVIARLTKDIAGEPGAASRADALLLHVHALSPSRPEKGKRCARTAREGVPRPGESEGAASARGVGLVIAPDDPGRGAGPHGVTGREPEASDDVAD